MQPPSGQKGLAIPGSTYPVPPPVEIQGGYLSQTRLGSLAETTINMIVGFWLSVLVQGIVFPLFGYDLPLHSNMAIVAIFTIVSMARSYVLRRMFNWISTRRAHA
jgi:hypothetical protein